MRIEGSTALVTGSNRGIGRAFTTGLLERGAAKVYAGARDPSAISDPDVVPVELDVTDDAQVRAVAERLGDVDLVVNNAGVGSTGAPTTSSLDEARRLMEVNYLGLLRVSSAFAPVLAGNGGGAFVNVLSIASWRSGTLLSTYSASKAAAWSITNALRLELHEQGTQVVGVHVGFVDTDLTAGLEAEKVSPETVVSAALDGLAAGQDEVLVDDNTRAVKAALSGDLRALYPELAA
jgi:NAD(P)-dependent dehydrogenase (short-subunit alcohol dehydrogenase family)